MFVIVFLRRGLRFRDWKALRLERVSGQTFDRDARRASQFKRIDEPLHSPLFNPGIDRLASHAAQLGDRPEGSCIVDDASLLLVKSDY